MSIIKAEVREGIRGDLESLARNSRDPQLAAIAGGSLLIEAALLELAGAIGDAIDDGADRTGRELAAIASATGDRELHPKTSRPGRGLRRPDG